ncbi:MAG TPA: secretin N-terminal domain-containing protein, partial [Verrucomicrobiota bacterium]|nr:secretin N-terminal domain-containing protein [Verrucomicrobiota bacterium]
GIRILPLTHADATTIASSLQRLLDERARPRGGGRRMSPSSRVAVIPDARSNSLLISGGPDGFDLVQTLVAQLDQPGTSLVGQVRLIPLEHADAGTLATTLSDLFTRRYQAARTPDMQRNRPVILADPRSNSLLVAAGVDDNQAIDALLVKLDRPPENPSVELSVLGLQYNDSARMAVTIRSVFAARLRSMTPVGQQPAPSDRVEVEADTLSNALVISASKPNLELVRELVAKLDAEPVATGGLIETFTLEHADVQRVSTLMRSLLDQGLYRPGLAVEGGRRSRRDALALATDARSNTLIVSASPENLLIVKELIRQLDTADFTGASDIRLFALKRARASHLATVLEQFFRARRASETAVGAAQRSAPVTVTADDRTNTLLITGGKESFDAVERMIEQLDTDTAMARTNFRVYELRHTTATKLQATLQRLFTNRPPRIQGQPPEPVTVIADGWANALIIGASDDDLAMVASLIEKLDTEQPSGGAQVQVFQMAKADARRVQQTLQSLFRGSAGVGAAPGAALAPVVLDVDERLNAIIVSAGETDLKRIADLVKKLDTDQVARVAEIRIFPLQNGRAVEMALVLNNVLNNNPRALTEASPNRQSLLQFITKTEEGERLITSALKEGILIVPDSRANSLVVSAPLDYMPLLNEVISHLDATAPTMAQIKVFHLKNADARQMAQVLTSLFRLQRVGPAGSSQQSVQYVMPAADATAPEGQAPADATGAVVGSAQEDALSVTVDFRTNSLLVGGTEHYVALATQIITTLDSTPAQERTAKVYRLKNARSQAVESSLRTFLQQDLQRIMSILGPTGVGTAQNILDREVSIVSETNSNSLLISASPRYFEEVRELVEELDQPQPQVLIQVLLAEVTLDSTTELGVEWDYTSDTDPVVNTGTDFGQRELLQDYGGYWASVTGSNYRFLVRALQNQGRLEVLSRPQILTADNQEATINIGQSVPVVQSTQVTPQGGTVSAIEYRDVGVMLTVTPRISPDGYVKMDVAPSISDLSSSKVTISKGEDLPIINQRTATTTVTVKSGQSVLIGGLIGTIDDERTKKVPLLGDIPGLGVLFRSKSKGQTRKELLVVLTPQILLKGEGEGRSVDAQAFTEEELRGSTIQGEFQRDPLQRRVLDPLLPPKTLESQTPQ